MYKHTGAPNLSRGFLLVIGLVGVGVSACASQSATPTSTAQARAARPLAPRAAAVRGEDVLMRSEQGSIDRDEAEAAIADNWPRLKNCYQEAGPAMSFAEGGVTLRFDVDVSGRTTGVEVIESKLGNFAVET